MVTHFFLFAYIRMFYINIYKLKKRCFKYYVIFFLMRMSGINHY